MEDLYEILEVRANVLAKLEKMRLDCFNEVHQLFFDTPAPVVAVIEDHGSIDVERLESTTPKQIKKRIRRLSSLQEDEVSEDINAAQDASPRMHHSAQLLAAVDVVSEAEEVVLNSTANLMPPPPVPVAASKSEIYEGRPQRAAKLKSEKNLKELPLNAKLRRPTNSEEVQVKLEHEHRQSQIVQSKTSTASLEDSVQIVPGKEPSIVTIETDDESSRLFASSQASDTDTKKLRIKVKREKVSVGDIPAEHSNVLIVPQVAVAPLSSATADVGANSDHSMLSSSTNTTNVTSNTTTGTTGKKTRKKKEHRPIKVERFSDIDVNSPVASRLRKGSAGKSMDSQKPQRSVYEDAIENLPASEETDSDKLKAPNTTEVAAVTPINETVNMPNATMNMGPVGDATINMGPAANATMNMGPAGNATINMGPAANATMNLGPAGNATMHLGLANATMDLGLADGNFTYKVNTNGCDATFDVPAAAAAQDNRQRSLSSNRSMATARECNSPQKQEMDDILTEDESFETSPPRQVGKKTVPSSLPIPQLPNSAKAIKMPTRTNELFNPLIQSPVKMRVEAFEQAAQNANEDTRKNTRSKRAKENAAPTNSSTTPVIGKLTTPTLGRFLTPTQSANVAAFSSAQPKKAPMSASKATTLLKTNTGTNLKSTISMSTKTLTRENSGEDFRKGLHLLAEERKRQREQKHLLAAQQREAKERERAERMAKLAKEREEKRLKKLQEQEQKKREIEELNRKMRQQEEAEAVKKAKAKAKAAQEQERELLTQMKQQQQPATKQKLMLPPPPKVQSKYTFDMLHEDDSTDDESKVSYKRPPVPNWSRSHVRGAAILLQQYCPTEVIDCFFSVEPTTPDLKVIFPNIDPRHLKRNSSVLWSTPPRYSELPKY